MLRIMATIVCGGGGLVQRLQQRRRRPPVALGSQAAADFGQSRQRLVAHLSRQAEGQQVGRRPLGGDCPWISSGITARPAIRLTRLMKGTSMTSRPIQ